MKKHKELVSSILIVIAFLIVCGAFYINQNAKLSELAFKNNINYTGFYYKFSYPPGWNMWEANKYLGLTVLSPESESEKMIKKDPTAKTVRISIVAGRPEIYSSRLKTIINNEDWYVKELNNMHNDRISKTVEYVKAVNKNLFLDITSNLDDNMDVEKIISAISILPQITSEVMIERGQQIGFFTVSDVQKLGEDVVVSYSTMGDTEKGILGKFITGPNGQLCFEGANHDWTDIPRLGGDVRNPIFCFSNQDEARKLYDKADPNYRGIANIRDYKQVISNNEFADQAKLVRIGLYK